MALETRLYQKLTQQLVMVNKDAQGKVRTRIVLPVVFVPLTGGPRPPGAR